jgi:Flp pilus assembly protein TadB
MISPVIAAILFASGIAILIAFFAPTTRNSMLKIDQRRQSLIERVQRSLKLAGMPDYTPIFAIVSMLGVTLVVAMILLVLVGSFWIIILAPILVLISWNIFIRLRQKAFLTRATDELIPFFNRIATGVQAGRPVPQAYVEAVRESNLLREMLDDSAAKITAGATFTDALLETIDTVPLRMWALFVRQLELHDQMGGNLGKALEETISQINEMLQLQAEARADYAAQARQQQIIFIIPLLGLLAFAFLVPGGRELMTPLVTTIPGIIISVLGLSVMYAGYWFSGKQLKSIEEKLAF